MWYENITLGQVVVFLASVAAVIGSISAITKVAIKYSQWRKNKNINPVLEEMANMEKRIMTKMTENDVVVNQKIDNLTKDVQTLDINQCKDVIIDFLTDIEAGNNVTSKEERAHEAYDRYTNVYNQNSYIHKHWEKIVEKTKE